MVFGHVAVVGDVVKMASSHGVGEGLDLGTEEAFPAEPCGGYFGGTDAGTNGGESFHFVSS